MSANTTNPGPTTPPVSPLTSTLDAVIQPSLNSIMIGHTFLTLLLPLLLALFYFSTPQGRKRPIFILNVVAIIFAFTAGTLIDALAIHSILSIQDPWPPSVNIAIGIIGAFQSLLVDTILLVRLSIVFPLSHLGLIRFALLTALPVLLKIARLTNLIIFIKVLVNAASGPLGAQNFAIVWATTPYLKIEWSAQVVDNAYASIAFLWAIRDRGTRPGVTSNIHPNRVSFSQRLRTLFRIAVSNFVIPSLFSIAQLIVVYRNVNVFIINDLVLVNTMLAVFGVVFATVWAGKVGRHEAEIDLWDDASRIDDGVEKRPARAFAFPGLGSWRVASAPPTVTFGSTRPAVPVGDVRLSAFDGIGSSNGNGTLLIGRDTHGGPVVTVAESLEAKVDVSRGDSTPGR